MMKVDRDFFVFNCKHCHGQGICSHNNCSCHPDSANGKGACLACNGSGSIWVGPKLGETTNCGYCGGRGQDQSRICPACHGKGKVWVGPELF